jgi:hypothetical protein
MGTCEVCGNQYDKTFRIIMDEGSHHFDSFECAIQALAPVCLHCKCKIIGHGVEANGNYFCCAHCAGQLGEKDLRDRTDRGMDIHAH